MSMTHSATLFELSVTWTDSLLATMKAALLVSVLGSTLVIALELPVGQQSVLRMGMQTVMQTDPAMGYA